MLTLFFSSLHLKIRIILKTLFRGYCKNFRYNTFGFIKQNQIESIMKLSIYFLMFFMFCSVDLNAQSDIKGKVKDKTRDRVEQLLGQGNEEEFDAVEEDSDEVEASEAEEEVSTYEKEVAPERTSYSKFDFIPGEKVIFFDDFEQDPVGDFPAKWNTNNNAEVVTISGLQGKWFKLPAEGGNYFPELKLTFPENVTIEVDVLLSEQNTFGITYYSEVSFDVDAYGVPGEAGAEVMISSDAHEFKNYNTGD